MNYPRIYELICESGKKVKNHEVSLVQSFDPCLYRDNGSDAVLVKHLIIPAGIWGSTDTPENTTYLTPHQQIVAYKLLCKIYPYSKHILETTKALVKARGKKKRKIPWTRRGHSPETRAKMSRSHTGKKFSAESRQKMSAAKKGKPLSEEHVRNRSASRIRNGKGFSEEARKNMSKAAKNRKKINKWSVG